MSRIVEMLEFADEFTELQREVAQWSHKTVGSDVERGPLTALRNLETAIKEASRRPYLRVEYAISLMLLLDAIRRAGFTPMQVVKSAREKLDADQSRKWVPEDGPRRIMNGTAVDDETQDEEPIE